MSEQSREELLALIVRLRQELWNYWEAYHDERCTEGWPHSPGRECLYPPPPVVFFWWSGESQ